MKVHFKIVLLFIISLYIKYSKSDILDIEKTSIDQLISLYNLPISTPVSDYCNITPYFICNSFKNATIEIYLDGSSLKPTIQNGIFKNFKYINILNIRNSIIYDTLFAELTTLKNFTLSSSELSQFPSDINLIQYLYFNDVQFSGTIKTSTIYLVLEFDILYSTQDFMGDYTIEDTLLVRPGLEARVFNLYLNNIASFTTLGLFYNFNLYLGNNFDMNSLQYLSTILTNQLYIYPGFNTIPLEIPNPVTLTKAKNVHFNHINFKSDYVLDFSQSTITLVFDGCTGLKNSSNDLNIILSSKLDAFNYINSDLTFIPKSIFQNGIKTINLNDNQISDQLPSLPLPTDSNQVLNINLSNNQINGEISQNYCYHYVNLTNNKLGGNLLDCYICSLNITFTRNLINGNQFSNYVSGTTDYNQFPKCPGIIVYNPSLIAVDSISYVNGENFGWETYVIEPNGNAISTVSSKPTVSNLNIHIPNRQIGMQLSNQTYYTVISNNYQLELSFRYPNESAIVVASFLKPTVNYVQIRSTYNIGYDFSFVGAGLPIGQDNTSNGNVTIDGMVCAITTATGQFLGCSLPQPQLPEKEYQAIIYNAQTKLYGSYKFNFTRVSPWISAVYPISPSGGLVSLFGSFGDGPYINLTVDIGKLPCDIKSVDAFKITCYLGAGTGVQNITLNLNGTTFFAMNYFRYTDSILSCPDCGIYGVCDGISGYCICRAGFGGKNCEQIFVKDPVITVNETLVQIIKEGYQFGFRLKDIKEFDVNSRVVKTYPLTNDNQWELTPDSTELKFTYSHKVNNTIISYTIEQVVGTSKIFEFAGQNFTLQPGSVKLSASILNWDYLGSLNTLKLQIESSAKSDFKNDCDGSSIIKSEDGSSINYLSIQKGENVLFGRFVDKVVSDSRPTFSSVTVESQTDESIIVSLSLPYCKECLLDPDFSVLINNVGSCSNQRAQWVIPTAVVVSVVGFVIIFLGLYILLKDKIYISFKRSNFGIVILKKSRSASSTTISMSDS